MLLSVRCPLCRCATRAYSSKASCRPIEKLLVANRGEIACRVMRTARVMGVRTVAVYSEADTQSLHTKLADEAHLLGPAPSADSYLRQDRVLELAMRTGADAIHPGYGFLSENAEFAMACEAADIRFVGPPASAITSMGLKSVAKQIMEAAGVACVPGYHEEAQDEATLLAEADKIGYPIMIKAVRGGGGKGMRIALNKETFLQQLDSARSESEKSFGDGSVILERFIERPRHIELQVFADTHGNVVHLFERDCSVQRRHQKIIEEAPAPGLAPEQREKLGSMAVAAARAVGYQGAGTVEFIADTARPGDYFFMEMNTRLQVEHPITEMITGQDLVEWQLRVAQGEPLPLTQEQLSPHGCAFEARVYAEDTRRGFLPMAGHLLHLSPPEEDATVRVDTGVVAGDEVSVFYDPMIAKLVVWAPDRISALRKLHASLGRYHIVGLPTNIAFVQALARHPEFIAENVHTNFIAEHEDTLFPRTPCSSRLGTLAALSSLAHERQELVDTYGEDSSAVRSFGFRLNGPRQVSLRLTHVDSETDITTSISQSSPTSCSITIGDVAHRITGFSASQRDDGELAVSCFLDNERVSFSCFRTSEEVHVFADESHHVFLRPQPAYLLKTQQQGGGSGECAPMPGVVAKVLVAAGDTVTKGQPLVVVVAMKMEHVIAAPRDAVVASVNCADGQTVAKGLKLVDFVEEE